MAENDVTTTLRLDPSKLREDVLRAKSEILKFKSDAEREKFELAVRAKFEKAEYQRQVRETVREMQRAADADPVKIRVQTEGGGGLFSQSGTARSELSGFGSLLRGGGPLVAGTLAVHALSEAMEKLNDHVAKGDASWGQFFDDFERGIPIFGKVFTLFDNATKAAENFQRIQEGLKGTEAQEAQGDAEAKRGEGRRRQGLSVAKDVDRLLTGGADDHALRGLEGPEAAREAARQAAAAHQAEVTKLIDEVNKQADRKAVEDQLEKLLAERDAIDADLVAKLAEIDEKEADDLGKAADKSREAAENFAAQAGEAALKAADKEEKEMDRAQDELDRARDQFLREMDRQSEETAKMGEDDLAARQERLRSPDQRGGGFVGSGGGEYGRRIQDAILAASAPRQEWAINGLQDLQSRNRMDGGPLSPGGRNKLDEAGAKLLKAGEKLAGLQVVGVVKY